MKRTILLTWFAALAAAAFLTGTSSAGTIVNFKISGLSFDVELYDDQTPTTVANFLGYVNAKAYDSSFIHRSTTYNPAQVQVIQGGAFLFEGNQILSIPTAGPIVNEPGISNLRGTIAMAKMGGDPNSATSQWFFNVSDNTNLDLAENNGGFTVFGHVVDQSGLDAIDAIAGLSVYNINTAVGAPENGPFNEVPLIPVGADFNLVMVDSVAVVPEPPALVLASLGVIAAAVNSLRRRRPFADR